MAELTREAPELTQLLSEEELERAEELAEGRDEPLGPRRIYSLLTRADRSLSDWAAFEAAQTKKAPWPLLEREHLGAVPLPEPATELSTPLSEALSVRRSKHHASAEPMPLSTLSTCLHWSAGIREELPAYNRNSYPFRYAPSAGGLQPIDLYLVANNIEDLAQGLYYYYPRGHELRLVDDGNLRRLAARAATYAEWLAYSSVVIFLVGDMDRVEWKYGERGYRFLHVDSGVLCQNLYLTGAASGLHTCAVAAYYDEEVCELLGIDGDTQFPVVMFGLSVPPDVSILSDELHSLPGPDRET
jgi:SagB-type dehydrogenase family enzyme